MTTFLPDAACVHLVTVNEHMVSGAGQDLRTPAEAVKPARSSWRPGGRRSASSTGEDRPGDDDASGNPGGPLTTDTVPHSHRAGPDPPPRRRGRVGGVLSGAGLTEAAGCRPATWSAVDLVVLDGRAQG